MPVSLDNETKAWEFIHDLMEKYIDRYPTSIQEDIDQVINDKTLTMNKRNCILFRKSEKVILHFMKESAAKVL